MKLNSNHRSFLAALGSSMLAVSSAHAQSGTWAVNAGGDWSTTTNWADEIVADGSGNTALFTMTNGGETRTINVDGDRTIGNITRSWAFGNQLIISGSAITLAGTTPTMTNNNAGNASRITIGSQILGGDGLNIAGGGFVELTNNTTNYTGATTITDGSLLSFGGIPLANIGGGSDRNISVGAGSIVHRNWQNLDNAFLNRIAQTNDEIGIFMSATAGSNNNNNLDFSSAGADLPNAFFGSWSSNGSIARYNGVITPASDNYRIGLVGSSGAFHIMQPLTDIADDPRGLIIGGGTPILAADNTFTGDTVLRAGRLFIGKQLALRNSALNVGNGSDGINGQFVFTNGPGGNAPPLDVVNAPTIGGLIGSRNLAAIYSDANQNNTNRLAASAVLGITLNPGTGETHTYGGNVALNTTMSLTKTGEGTQILAGANTYTGDTTISEGILQIGDGTDTAGSLALTNVSITSGATLQISRTGTASNALQYAGSLSGNGTVNIVSGARIDLTANQTNSDDLAFQVEGTLAVRTAAAPSVTEVHLGEISGAGSIIRGAGSGGAATLFIGGKGSSSTFSGNIGSAELGVEKVGSGTLTFTGPNAYGGSTTVSDGTLALVGGSITSPITVAAGASLGFTLGSSATSSGSVDLTSGTVKITGTVDNVTDYLLMTATGGFTGTPVLDAPIAGYALDLQATGTELWLIATGAAPPYATWSGGAAPDEDTNNDGVKNAIAWALGAVDPNENAIALLPVIDNTTDPDYLIFSFNRSNAAEADPDTAISVEYDTDLQAPWTTAVHDGDDVIIETGTSGPDTTPVTVKLKRSTLAPGGKLFVRLQSVVTIP